MKVFAVTVAFALVAGPAGQAFAHLDHSLDSGIGLRHIVSDPIHLSVLAVAASVAYAARHVFRRRAH